MHLRRNTFFVLFVERPPSYAFSKIERLAGEDKSNLLHKSTGPFRVIYANLKSMTVDETYIPNTISIDRGTAFPGT